MQRPRIEFSPSLLSDAVVTVEGGGLQVPAIIFEKGGRSVPLVIRREVEHGQRVERIADVGPCCDDRKAGIAKRALGRAPLAASGARPVLSWPRRASLRCQK